MVTISKILPIYKSEGYAHHYSKYQEIELMSDTMKLLERVIENSLIKHFRLPMWIHISNTFVERIINYHRKKFTRDFVIWKMFMMR